MIKLASNLQTFNTVPHHHLAVAHDQAPAIRVALKVMPITDHRPVARKFYWGGSFEGNVNLFLLQPFS